MRSGRTGAGRVYAVGTILVLLVSFLAGVGLVTSAVPSTHTAHPAIPTPAQFLASKGIGTGPALTASEQATVRAAQASFASPLKAPTLDEMLAALAETVPHQYTTTLSEIRAGETSGLHLDSGCSAYPAWACPVMSIGVVALIALVCATAGAESVGLACIAALAIGAIIIGIQYFLGLNGANAASLAASTAGGLMLSGFEQTQYNLAGAEVTIASLFNTTSNALDYAAAAAALLQISNVSWDGPLDLIQSGIAANISGVWSAEMTQIELDVATTLNNFQVTLGTTDSSGFGCEVSIVADAGNVLAGAKTTSCGGATGSPTYQAWGWNTGIGGSVTFTTGGVFYLAKGSVISGASATPTLHASDTSLYSPLYGPMSNPSAWFNFSSQYVDNVSVPKGSEWIVEASAGLYSVACQICWPLNTATTGATGFNEATPKSQGVFGVDQLNGAAVQASYTNNTPALFETGASAGFREIGSIASCPAYGASTSSITAACDATTYLGFGSDIYWLIQLTLSASSLGQTYFTFLHLLGYFSLSSIPSRCIIPTPNTVLQGVPPSELEGANITYLLALYETYLQQLGFTYNATSYALNTTTFCNHPLPVPAGNLTGQFSTYGIGYGYAPNATKNANGTATQHFGTPSSWNISGEIFLAPVLHQSNIPVNTTWLFSTKTVGWAVVVPYTNGSGYSTRVIANGPTLCVVNGKCNVGSAARMYILPLVYGNSSQAGGGVLSTGTGAAGYAFNFLECWYATNATNEAAGKYQQNSSCLFKTGNITPPPPPCNNPSGCGGGGGLGGGNPCGLTLPIFAQFTAGFYGFFSFLGNNLGCALSEIAALVLIVVILVVAIYLIALVVRIFRGSGRKEG